MIIILVGVFSFIRILGEAFGVDCEKNRNWTIGEYKIQEYKCLGWTGPHYYPLDLYKNGILFSESGFKKDSCIIEFQPKPDLYIRLNICTKQIEELRPNKRLIEIQTVDSGFISSKILNQRKELDKKHLIQLIEDWNHCKVSDYRDKHIDSLFYPDYKYKIIIYANGIPIEFIASNYLIADSSKWVYKITNGEDIQYFDRIWKYK